MDWRWVGGFGRSGGWPWRGCWKCYCGLLMIQLLLKDLRMIDIIVDAPFAVSARSKALNRRTIELWIIMLFDKRFLSSSSSTPSYAAALTVQQFAVVQSLRIICIWLTDHGSSPFGIRWIDSCCCWWWRFTKISHATLTPARAISA